MLKTIIYDTIEYMALTPKKKTKIVEKFRTHEKDTGSSEVQIALLTNQIQELTEHLKKNHKDNHSRRGLLGMVARRKKLFDYLKETNLRKHNALIKKLGIKR